ncbi:hypothetical protein AHF37_09113 [Paragonimus kellicotti]|nr:hypothetical protein AHF37_09113 [Paragonimus kellicotti]
MLWVVDRSSVDRLFNSLISEVATPTTTETHRKYSGLLRPNRTELHPVVGVLSVCYYVFTNGDFQLSPAHSSAASNCVFAVLGNPSPGIYELGKSCFLSLLADSFHSSRSIRWAIVNSSCALGEKSFEPMLSGSALLGCTTLYSTCIGVLIESHNASSNSSSISDHSSSTLALNTFPLQLADGPDCPHLRSALCLRRTKLRFELIVFRLKDRFGLLHTFSCHWLIEMFGKCNLYH